MELRKRARRGRLLARRGPPKGGRRGAGSRAAGLGASAAPEEQGRIRPLSAPEGEVTKPGPLVSPGVLAARCPASPLRGMPVSLCRRASSRRARPGAVLFPRGRVFCCFVWQGGHASPLRNAGGLFPCRTRRLQVYGAQPPSSAVRAELTGRGCFFRQD